jgi:hypothetical protein
MDIKEEVLIGVNAAFYKFLKEEAPQNYDASISDAMHIFKWAYANGVTQGKEDAISIMRKFFETEFENVIDALEEQIR